MAKLKSDNHVPPHVNALNKALALAERGYVLTPVTIRRGSDGRKQATYHRRWGHKDGHSSLPREIRGWSDQYRCSFAVVCGPSGVEVVDLDIKPGVDGVSWWDSRGLGASHYVVHTLSGGRHLYFRRGGDELPNSVGAVPGVDTRNSRGVVYAEGSFIEGEKGSYYARTAVVAPESLTETPKAVLDLLGRADTKTRVTGGVTFHDLEWMTDKCLEQLSRVRNPQTGGTGFRSTLIGAAMVYGRCVNAGVISPEEALSALHGAVTDVWGSVDSDDEKWIEDGMRRGPELERWELLRPVPGVSGGETVDGVDVQEREPEGDSPLSTLLPRPFWEASEELKAVRQAALARSTSPDAILLGVLTRISHGLHHGTRVDTGAGPYPLGMFTCLVGDSGAGKSNAIEAARVLCGAYLLGRTEVLGRVRPDEEIRLGSGEGLVESFLGFHKDPETGKYATERTQLRHNALAVQGEGSKLFETASRSGSTLFSTLRLAWDADQIGEQGATVETTRRVGRGRYLFNLTFAIQTGCSEKLFSDAEGGFPQRTVFAQATYPDLLELDDDAEFPFPRLLNPSIPTRAFTAQFDPAMKREIRVALRKQGGGASHKSLLDGQRLGVTCRVATLLSFLHGECETVSVRWWNAAKQLMEVSCNVRDHLHSLPGRREQEKVRARKEQAVAIHVASAEEVHSRVERATEVILSGWAKRIEEQGPMSLGKLWKGTDHKQCVRVGGISYRPTLVTLFEEMGYVLNGNKEYHKP